LSVNDALLHGPFYGNFYVRLVGAIGFAYLLASIPIGPLTRWLFTGLDWRLGSSARGLTPPATLLQAFLPVEIAVHGGGIMIGFGAGIAVVAAHCYCPWLRFRGGAAGAGAAIQLGALCALSWQSALIFGMVWLVAAIASNYATIGTLTATAVSFLPLWFFLGPIGALYGVIVMVLVAGANREAFSRLMNDTEQPMRVPESEEGSPLIVRFEGQPIQSF
jgi:glycerol-3-phosphate acyltransferase PlsY